MSKVAIIFAVVVSCKYFGLQFFTLISLSIQLLLLSILRDFWLTDVPILYSRGAIGLVYSIGSLLSYSRNLGQEGK